MNIVSTDQLELQELQDAVKDLLEYFEVDADTSEPSWMALQTMDGPVVGVVDLELQDILTKLYSLHLNYSKSN